MIYDTCVYVCARISLDCLEVFAREVDASELGKIRICYASDFTVWPQLS